MVTVCLTVVFIGLTAFKSLDVVVGLATLGKVLRFEVGATAGLDTIDPAETNPVVLLLLLLLLIG